MIWPINLIPQEFIDVYGLAQKLKNGYLYIEIQRGVYGLPQAGILANNLLTERLLQHDYFEVPYNPSLFWHTIRPIWFFLVVDDFGIKYVGKEHVHVQHLRGILKEFYEVEEDWTGSLYLWNYTRLAWMLPLAVDGSIIIQGASAILETIISQLTQPLILPTNLRPNHHQQCTIAYIQ